VALVHLLDQPSPCSTAVGAGCSELCSLLDIDGVRGDIVTNRAVRALVAFEGRKSVTAADVERVVPLCLNHRCGRAVAVDCVFLSVCVCVWVGWVGEEV
jgi:Mg-chelatase subunit ChlI